MSEKFFRLCLLSFIFASVWTGAQAASSQDQFNLTPASFLQHAAAVDVPAVPQPVKVQVGADLNIYFISVGQGDSEYIELPNGQNVLIDGGPLNGPIADFLTSHNVKKIDYVVLTHPHADHFTGLAEALTTLAPGGYVLVEGARYEAFCQSGFAAKGSALRVVGLDNFRLIVTQS